MIPNVLLVSALGLAKENLVFSHWDTAWITFCILGIASIAVCVGAFASGHWKRKNIEVLRTSHSLECLLTRCIVACSRIRVLFTVYPPHFSVRRIIQHVLISVSPSLHDEMPAIDETIRVVVLTYLSSLWMKSLFSTSEVSNHGLLAILCSVAARNGRSSSRWAAFSLQSRLTPRSSRVASRMLSRVILQSASRRSLQAFWIIHGRSCYLRWAPR